MSEENAGRNRGAKIAYPLLVACLVIATLFYVAYLSPNSDVHAEAAKGSFVLMSPGHSRGMTGDYDLACLYGGSMDLDLADAMDAWSKEMVSLVKALGEDLPSFPEEKLRAKFVDLITEAKLKRVPRQVRIGAELLMDEHNSVKWVKGLWNYHVLVFVNKEIGQRYHWWCRSYTYPYPYNVFAYYDASTGIMYVAISRPLYGNRYYCQAVHLLKARQLGRVLLEKSLVEGTEKEE